MIPRVSRLGTGFSGAGLYYLHDKRELDDNRPSAEQYMLHDKGGAQTSNRLGFVELRNLPVRDPNPDDRNACYEAAQKALRCMAWTAAHARDIRQASVAAAARGAGMSYDDYIRTFNPYRGRPGQKPLYSLSIAFHPTKERMPTRQEMVTAADEVLAALGMSDRQCVIIQHTDTKHPHAHLIINRVSPETGLYAKTSNDFLRVSAWALDWERRTGLILCTERMFNWEKRNANRQAKAMARTDNPRARGAYVRGKDVPRADRDWWKAHEHLPEGQIRAAREGRQKAEAAKFNGKEARRVLLADAKIARTLGKQRGEVLKELRALKADALYVPARRPGIAGAVRELFRKTANAITRTPVRRRGTIERLRESAQALDTKIDEQKKSVREDVARAWTRLERRHEVERERDEERIARRQREARGRQSGERALKQFNLRGDDATARQVQPSTRPLTLTNAFVAAALREAPRKTANLLSRLAQRLGRIMPARPRDAETMPRRTDVTPSLPKPVPVKAAFEQSASPAQEQKRQPDISTAAYERRVEKNLNRLERAERREQRQRRPRKRPRSKGRRMGES